MQASQPCEPYSVTFYKPDMNNALIGKTFKQDQAKVKQSLVDLGENHYDEVPNFVKELEEKGEAMCNGYKITKDMIKSFKPSTKQISEKKFDPNVIEPSFGVGRVLYSVLEHSYYVREGSEKRGVLKFKPCVAPTKCGIIPLNNVKKEDEKYITDYVDAISNRLNRLMLSNSIDDSSVSIGKKYARFDEVGTPFCITIDSETLTKHYITLRERDSMEQVRISVPEHSDNINVNELCSVIYELTHEHITWDDIIKKFEKVQSN